MAFLFERRPVALLYFCVIYVDVLERPLLVLVDRESLIRLDVVYAVPKLFYLRAQLSSFGLA